ncbi:hypothetical protein BDA99DRAFT_496330, partial [Phascolomyces articulosus]
MTVARFVCRLYIKFYIEKKNHNNAHNIILCLTAIRNHSNMMMKYLNIIMIRLHFIKIAPLAKKTYYFINMLCIELNGFHVDGSCFQFESLFNISTAAP